MEKLLWTLLAMLWLGMISAAAFANDVNIATNRAQTDVIRADSDANRSVVDGPRPTPMLSVSNTLLPAAPISNVSLTASRLPVIQAGSHGGAELAGAFVVCGGAVWSARRRRII